MPSLPIIADAGNNLNIRRQGADGEISTPRPVGSRTLRNGRLCVLVWDGCQDASLRSGNAVGILCTSIWVLKSEIRLYVREIFWKDTKGTVNSGTPQKKDTGTGCVGEERRLIFHCIPFCVLTKNVVFFFVFFFLLCACIIFSIKKKVGRGFKQAPSPRPQASTGFSVSFPFPVCSPVLRHCLAGCFSAPPPYPARAHPSSKHPLLPLTGS